MNSRARTLFIAIVLAITGTACGSGDDSADEPVAAPTSAMPEEGVWTYVALGGSIASGAGDIYGQSYVDYYKDLLEEDTGNKVELIDLSIGEGGTTQAVLDLLGGDTAIEDLRQAEVVTMEIGGNDLVAGDEPLSAGECEGLACYRGPQRSFENNYEKIVQQVATLVGEGTILRAVTFYNPAIGDPELKPSFEELTRKVTEIQNEATCNLAEAAGWLCVDVYPAFNGSDGLESPSRRGLIAGDFTHPSENGHRLIARLLQEAGYEPSR